MTLRAVVVAPRPTMFPAERLPTVVEPEVKRLVPKIEVAVRVEAKSDVVVAPTAKRFVDEARVAKK